MTQTPQHHDSVSSVRFTQPLQWVSFSETTPVESTAKKAQQPTVDLTPIRQVVTNLEKQLAQLRQREQERLAIVQQQAIELAIAVTSKILFQEIERNQYPFEQLINELLGDAEPDQPVTISVHPDDRKIVDLAKTDNTTTAEDTGRDTAIQWVADHSLLRGSVVIETGQETRFYSAALQVDELWKKLLEAASDTSC